MAIDDNELTRRLRHGDESALTELYRRHRPSMLAVAQRMLGDRESAEDAVQQAVVTAWQSFAQLDSWRGNIQTWLRVITRQAAIDHYRRERRRRFDVSLFDHAPQEVLAVPGPSMVDSWHRQQVHQALTRLHVHHRQVLRLAYFDQLTHPEIAEHLRLPVGTVKSRIARAQLRLAVLLSHLKDE